MRFKKANKIPIDFLVDKAILIGLSIIMITLSFTLGFIVGRMGSNREKATLREESTRGVQEVSHAVGEVTGTVEPMARLETESIATEKASHIEEPVVSSKETTEEENIEKEDIPPKKGAYTIQVGAFQKKDEAEKLLNILKKKGYSVRIVMDNRKGLYKVRVGSFTARASAEALAVKLSRNEKIATLVVKQK